MASRSSTLLVTAITAAGCGRISFDAVVDATQQPACSWKPEPVFAGAPQLLATVSSAQSDGDPTLSSDYLELFWAANGIRHAVRATRESPFVAMGTEAGLDMTTGELNGFSLSHDGLTGYFARRLADSADIYRVQRASRTGAFGPAIAISELNTAGHEFNPRVSPDDRTIVYVHWADTSTITTADAYFAHRGAPGDAWSGVERAGYSTTMADAASSFIGDTNTVVFETAGDLFVAHRANTSAPFDPAISLSAINTASYDGLPFASSDGCELFFVSNRSGGVGMNDLYRVAVLP